MFSADNVISEILLREGSAYTDYPADRGGPTKYGITLATLAQARPGATKEDVQALDESSARDIYRRVFVSPFAGYQEPDLGLLVDSAVQHGVGRVKGWLQQINCRSAELYARLLAHRIEFYGAIVENDPTQSKFIKGWLNRASEFIR